MKSSKKTIKKTDSSTEFRLKLIENGHKSLQTQLIEINQRLNRISTDTIVLNDSINKLTSLKAKTATENVNWWSARGFISEPQEDDIVQCFNDAAQKYMAFGYFKRLKDGKFEVLHVTGNLHDTRKWFSIRPLPIKELSWWQKAGFKTQPLQGQSVKYLRLPQNDNIESWLVGTFICKYDNANGYIVDYEGRRHSTPEIRPIKG